MIKVVTLLFKRPELTAEAFRDYYELHHRLLGEKYLSPHALKYVRRYPILAGDGAEAELEGDGVLGQLRRACRGGHRRDGAGTVGMSGLARLRRPVASGPPIVSMLSQ